MNRKKESSHLRKIRIIENHPTFEVWEVQSTQGTMPGEPPKVAALAYWKANGQLVGTRDDALRKIAEKKAAQASGIVAS